MKKPEKLSLEKLEKIKALQEMMKNPLAKDLEKLAKILSPSGEAMLLPDAAKKTGISEQGIGTICASTKNNLEIFSEEKGGKKFWYIKIKKKQP